MKFHPVSWQRPGNVPPDTPLRATRVAGAGISPDLQVCGGRLLGAFSWRGDTSDFHGNAMLACQERRKSVEVGVIVGA